VLDGILNARYLQHWLLLVYCVYELLKESVSKKKIVECEKKLLIFVSDVGKLYGSENVSYNVHQLIHLCHTVRLFGPLWCSSNFVFEDHNGKLLNWFSGSRSVPSQIARSFLLLRSLQMLSACVFSDVNNCKSPAEALVDKLTGNYPLVRKAIRVSDGVTFLGKHSETRFLTKAEVRMLKPLYSSVTGQERMKFYHRAIINGKAYCTLSYGANFKTNNFTVLTHSNKFGEIVQFVSVPIGSTFAGAVFLKLQGIQPSTWKHSSSGTILEHIHELKTKDPVIIAIDATEIKMKCVVMCVSSDHTYCSLQPNDVEKD
jgi:hypothetical protein